MNAWILADALAALVLVPALAITLGRLLRTLRGIAAELVPITAHCAEIVPLLDAVPRLAEAEMLTGAGLAGVTRYTTALEKAL